MLNQSRQSENRDFRCIRVSVRLALPLGAEEGRAAGLHDAAHSLAAVATGAKPHEKYTYMLPATNRTATTIPRMNPFMVFLLVPIGIEKNVSARTWVRPSLRFSRPICTLQISELCVFVPRGNERLWAGCSLRSFLSPHVTFALPAPSYIGVD